MKVLIGHWGSEPEAPELAAKIVPTIEVSRLKVDLPIGWEGEERIVREIGWLGLSQRELEMLMDEPESVSGLIVPRPLEDGAYDIVRGEGQVKVDSKPYTAQRLAVQSFIELAPILLEGPITVESI